MSAHKNKAAKPDRRFGAECAAPSRQSMNVDAASVVLDDVENHLKPGEVVELQFGRNRAQFAVCWVGRTGTEKEGHLGLRSVGSGHYVWDLRVAEEKRDSSESHGHELRLKLSHS